MKNKNTLSGLTVSNFSKQIDGKETMLCILTNKKGAELTITNYGAKIVSLMVPDRSGKLTDVVTGHNSLDDYLVSEEPYFATVTALPKEHLHWMVLYTISWLSTTAPTASTED